jgi:argininosuccinate lyase
MALWGGRFNSGPAQSLFTLSRSVHFDYRLAAYDLRASMAHLSVLESSGLIDKSDSAKIAKALRDLMAKISNGNFAISEEDEDIHSALERAMLEEIGEAGGKLRAGRSRNDQVATDLRLFSIDQMLHIAGLITELQSAFLVKAKEYADAPAPGFTHLQHAQPILFGHELAKHIHSFARDLDRINDWLARTSYSPLGAAALAGSSLPLKPEVTARELGFIAAIGNSIDAVSDRDFVAEALFIMAMIGVHLSRIGEEWCIMATSEFAWAELDDAFSTGSSIMPQKKNPDVAELARGKAGRLVGNLTGVLTMLKGLPFAYNRDLQEDKEPLFDSIDTLNLVLPALTGMVATTSFNRVRMAAAAPAGFSLATEIADYLVRKNVPFAHAHEAAGRCVAIAEAQNKDLHQLSDSEFKSAHKDLDAGVRSVLSVEGALAGRTTHGGTAPSELKKQFAELESQIKSAQLIISNETKSFFEMMSI